MSKNEHVFRLEGLSCMNCAAKFEKNVQNLSTVSEAQVNFGASKIRVVGQITSDQVDAAGAFDGIKVAAEEVETDIKRKKSFWQKKSNMTTFISFLFIIVGYTFYFTAGEKHTLTIASFILAMLIGGSQLFKVGLKNLAKLEFDMKTLMTIAIIGAAIIGEWGEGAVVVFLFALSEALEGYSIDKARNSIRSLVEIAPKKALIRRGTEELELHVKDIMINDIILIKPGQKVAMDGIVTLGQSSINQATITGESIPVHKSLGDEVFAGTLNEEGFLEVRVTKKVEDTTIAKIIHLVEEAQAEKAPSQQFVDKFAKYYTPAIMVVAFLIAAIPPLFFSSDWSDWIYSGLAVLVVGCPCALVISTPVAIVTAVGNAARNGVLIKGGIHLEEVGRLNIIAFDKTGTLTKGKPQVTNLVSYSKFSNEEILRLAVAIERYSQHPLASAIINYAKELKVEPLRAENFQSITGKGAQADINGQIYLIGSPSLFNHLISHLSEMENEITTLETAGKTVMVIGTEDQVLGLIAVADVIREGTDQIMEKLKGLGIKKAVMLTGDNKRTATAIGNQISMSDVKADLLPEEKLSSIKQLKAKYGRVAMVGDGVNDAPALATANVGIAMGGAGTDTALETADIALMADDLAKLPYTVALSRKTLRIIKENITFALAVKLIALLLVIPGWLTLWIAIFADVGATIIVVLNSLRLMKANKYL